VKVNIHSTVLGVCGSATDTSDIAEARASILSQILEPDAADRLGRIRLVKQSRAEDVENRLIMLARSGQLKQKISEAQLKDILGAMSEQQEKKETVKVSRRKGGWDDDDLEDLLNDD
jgi:programmed cell death protein 5